MCGPLTCFLFKKDTSKWAIFQYQFFRLLSYSSVALILSIIGEVALKNMSWNRFSSFVLWALIAVVILQLVYQFIGKKLQTSFPQLISSKWLAVGLGAITGLLPCGLLIPAYIGASSMESKPMVLLAITLFFAGTLPAMLMSQSILQQLKKRLPTMLQPWLNSGLGIIFLLVQVWMLSKHN
jgi:sulfite exporter TauE/SafE